MMPPPAQPLGYNLLELFKQKRPLVDILDDPTALFVLAFVNEIGETTRAGLQGELALTPDEFAQIIANLNRAELLGTRVDRLYVTAGGREFLDDLGLAGGAPPPPTNGGRTAGGETPGWLWGLIAFLGTGAVLLLLTLLVGICSLPPILATNTPTPSRPPSPTATPTTTVTPTITPTPTPTFTRTFTPMPTRIFTLTPTRTFTPTPTRTFTPTPLPGGVKGYVLRAYDQKSIPGARVQISPGSSVVSLDGSYGFSGLAPGNYVVSANATGYYNQQNTLTIASGQMTTLNFTLIKAPEATGAAVTLRQQECFNFEQGEYIQVPSGIEFYTCPTRADVQWWSNTLKAINGAGIAPAMPQASAYESCSSNVAFANGVTNPLDGKYYCVSTGNDRTAVIRITAVDSYTNKYVTFDWWLY